MSAGQSFESAGWLAAWAGTEIDNLEATVARYWRTNPAAMVEEINPQSRQKEKKLRIKALPDDVRGHTANIVKNLRDALDQVVYGATFHILGKPKRNAHFPFGSSPDDLKIAMKRNQCKDIPVELYPILQSHEPYPTGDSYPGGNNFLRLLGRVSGPHKHSISLIVNTDAKNITMSGFSQAGPICCAIFPFLEHRPKNDEIVLLSWPLDVADPKADITADLYVAFSHPDLREIPVISFLRTCHGSVTHIVQDLQAQALRLPPRV